MFKQHLKDLFGIDYRALGVFRIGLGVFLLVDLIWRAADLTAFYTDFGILPREILFSRFHVDGTLSFHTLSGSFSYQSVLFVLAGVFALCLLLGLYTRTALFLSWIFLISLHNRNEIILEGADHLLRAFLFWSLFLPVDKRYSLDAIRKKTTTKEPRYFSAATFALLAQMVIMYEFAGFSKYHPIWFKEGTACFYVLASGQFTKPLGLFLLQFPGLLKFFTFGTLFLEIVVPVLAFIPWHNKTIRLWIVALLCLFHLGLFLAMELGLFPLICMLGWIPYLPVTFWDRLEKQLPVKVTAVRLRRYFHSSAKTKETAVAYTPSVLGNLFASLFFIYILIWNFKSFDPRYRPLMPASLLPVGYALRLDQNWKLFSPHPSTDCGWHVFVGTLCDGTQVDLLKGEGPVSWDQPEPVASIYKGYRWRKYFKSFLAQEYAEHRLYYCQYLCRKWNQNLTQPPLKKVELYYLKTPLFPDRPSPPATRYLVWDLDCGDCP